MQKFFDKYKIEDERIAVGVSGGADSLALVIKLAEIGKRVVALTVDHALRKESRIEAEYVAKIMFEHGIEHHILTWNEEKPKKGIEEAARRARYGLLFDFCKLNNIGILAVGHHLRDQAETFLLRLQRGSGVFGLSCMQPISLRDGVKIIRPQLDMSPEDLKTYLLAKNIKWIEDPMNDDIDFARVRIRKFLPELKKIGIDEKRLSDTAKILANTRCFIQRQVDVFVENNVRWWGGIAASLSWNKLKDLDMEVSMPVLGQLLQEIGDADYYPEAVELARVLTETDKFKGCTLGKCELVIAAKRLWIIPQDTKNELMTRLNWDMFLKKFPMYKNAGLPYKVRRALWQGLEG